MANLTTATVLRRGGMGQNRQKGGGKKQNKNKATATNKIRLRRQRWMARLSRRPETKGASHRETLGAQSTNFTTKHYLMRKHLLEGMISFLPHAGLEPKGDDNWFGGFPWSRQRRSGRCGQGRPAQVTSHHSTGLGHQLGKSCARCPCPGWGSRG